MIFKPFTPGRLRRRVFGQLWMLALQFILGMILNLLGDHAKGLKHAAYMATLVLHILNAIGLLEGGVYIALKERGGLARYSALAVTLTFCAGVLTVLTKNDAWSFVMACGFLVSSWLYIALYIKADRTIRNNK